MKTMFKNGLIVNGKNEPAFIGNVIIEDEKIINKINNALGVSFGLEE